jgi:hypothetical protein
MNHPPHFPRILALALLLGTPAFGQLAPGPDPIVGINNNPQTISGGTGTVNGTLSVGGSTVAITVKGSSTIVNNGSILQTGTASGSNGRAIRDNTGGLTLVVDNGSTTNSTALIQSADADAFQMNKASSNVTLNNYGTITSMNASSGGNQAIDWNAIATGTNTLFNFSSGVITANNADSVRPGINGSVFNDGLIKSLAPAGSSSDGIDGQTNSGISITNAFSAAGAVIEGARHGITGGNTTTGVYSMTVTNNVGGTIKGDDGSGINIDGINGLELVTVTNGGTITGNGVSRDGDGVDVDGLVNLNNSGVIKSLNSLGTIMNVESSEGVTVGGGTIVNSGTIEGDVASGNTTAIGRGITLAGVDKDSNGNPIPIEGIYANTSVTNSGLIKGQSDSGIAVLGPNTGFTVSITNSATGTIEGAGASAATIAIASDNATINNAGSIINDGGDGKTAVDLGSGDSHLTISGGHAVVVGGINGGSGNDTLTFDLGAPTNAFAHSGVISNFNKVEVLSGVVTLNGNNTYAGTTTVGDGTNSATLLVNGTHSGGGSYTVKSGGTLGGTGTLDLASSSTAISVQDGGTMHVSPGVLTVQNGSLDAEGTLEFDLDGAAPGAPGGYGQLLFSAGDAGSITLGADSKLQLDLGFDPTSGEQFELIDVENPGTSISGTFNGLAEGSIFTDGGRKFEISYKGGTGNDLVVTTVPDIASTAILVFAGALALASIRRRSPAAVLP